MLSVRILLPALLGVFLFFPPIAFTQQVGQYDSYTLRVEEKVPSPGMEVTVHIRSGTLRVSAIRSVRWFVNNREREEFRNKLSLKESVGNTAKTVTARIVYFTLNGDRRYIDTETQINPVTFDLLWEGESVTTPLYRGYPLAGPEVPIRVYAEIQYVDSGGATYTEDDFSFVWEVETSFHDRTGPGVSSIVYEEGGSLINRSIFFLARATLINDHRVQFEKAIRVPITDPRLIVYPYTLTRGLITEQVIPASVRIREQPLTVSPYPFYFSRDDFVSPGIIDYSWFIDNAQTPSKRGRKVDISLQGDGVVIPIRVLARNGRKTQQEVENLFDVSL